MYDGLFSTEPYVTPAYSELEAYSEPYQMSKMENFIQNHSLACLKPWHNQNPSYLNS